MWSLDHWHFETNKIFKSDLKVRSSFFAEIGAFNDESLKEKVYQDYILGHKSKRNKDTNENIGKTVSKLTPWHDQIMEDFYKR